MEILEKQEHSKAFLNKRKFLMVLPLLVLPFMTLTFWVLGGGSASAQSKTAKDKGFNMILPSAENPSDSTLDKLAFYAKAEKDSIELSKNLQNDPYYLQEMKKNEALAAQNIHGTQPTLQDPGRGTYTGGSYVDPNEKRVNDKLKELNAALNAPSQQPIDNSSPGNKPSVAGSEELARIEKMVAAMQSGSVAGSTGGDSEMQQISAMLGQILDIQHPDRVKDRLRESSAKNVGVVYAVSTSPGDTPISVLEQGKTRSYSKNNGFFSLNEEPVINDEQNTVRATVHETQTLVSGAIVKMRLSDDIFINGQLIPKDVFVFGVADVQGERLKIEIKSIRYKDAIYPVNLGVYDLDGLDGVHIPGAIGRDVAKQSGDNALQNISLSSGYDQSMGFQAMGAGLEAAKSLFSKKIKLIKVTVKAGYQVLLKDQKSSQN